jgi:hypothetical protein
MQPNRQWVLSAGFFFLASFLMAPCANAEFMPQITKIEDSGGRKEYAKRIMASLRKINDSIPVLSPSQKAWLDNENTVYRRTNNHTRYLEVMRSKEYTMQMVKTHTNAIIDTLTLITEANKTTREVYLWSLVATDLLGSDYWSNMVSLVGHGILDEKLFLDSVLTRFDFDMIYFNYGSIVSSQILRNIIQPFLSGALPISTR